MKDMNKVDAMEEKIIEFLGYEQAFKELCKALDYDTKEEMFDYIMRMWDIDTEEE